MPQAKPRTAALLASVDEVEAQFYEALQAGDLARVMAVWADDDEIACVHPGGPRVVGHGAIRAAFESIFAHGAIPVRAHHVRRIDSAGCSVHSVVERIDITTAEGPQTAWVLATNVYLKTAQGWRLALHHASPGSPRAAQELVEKPSTIH